MEYARNKIWKTSNRWLCELHTDGSVSFIEDITEEELKWCVIHLLHELEHKRQIAIELLKLKIIN